MKNILARLSFLNLSDKIKVKLDNKKMAIVILAVLVIIYLDFSYLMKLQFRTIGNVSAKVAKLKNDLNELQNSLKNIQELKNRQALTQRVLEKAKKSISETDIAELLQEISDIANKNQVRLLQLNPDRQAKFEPPADIMGMEKLKPLLLNLELSCDYHHLGKFINDLEKSQMFFAVQNLKIEAVHTDLFAQHINLVLLTYVKK